VAWTPLPTVGWLGLNTETSAAIDTTGADLLVVVTGQYPVFAATVTITDSKSNTWHQLTAQVQGNVRTLIHYAWNPIVGTGHTFTFTSPGGNIYCNAVAAAFSGSRTVSDPLDSQNGAVLGSGTSIQPGSAGASGMLFVCGCVTEDVGGAKSINTGTKYYDVPWSSGLNMGTAAAYKVQVSADNPTWSWANANAAVSVIASFLAPDAPDLGLTQLVPTQESQMPRPPWRPVPY
jgi:hypothetical protein